MLAAFYAGAVVLIGAAGLMAGGRLIFLIGLIAFAAHLAWQVARLDIDDPAHCLMLFKSNRDAGLILFARDAAAGGGLGRDNAPRNDGAARAYCRGRACQVLADHGPQTHPHFRRRHRRTDAGH